MLLGADVPVLRAHHRLYVFDRVCGRRVQPYHAFARIAARQQQQRGVAALVVLHLGRRLAAAIGRVTVVSVPAPSSPRRARSAALECRACSRLASRACTTSACFAAAVSASRARTARRGTPCAAPPSARGVIGCTHACAERDFVLCCFNGRYCQHSRLCAYVYRRHGSCSVRLSALTCARRLD